MPLRTQDTVWKKPAAVPDVRSRSVVVAAFDKVPPEELAALGQAMPHGGNFTVISQEKVKLPKGNFKARWVKGHPASAAVLQKAGAPAADSLLIAGLDGWSNTEADIQVWLTITNCSPSIAALHCKVQWRGLMRNPHR